MTNSEVLVCRALIQSIKILKKMTEARSGRRKSAGLNKPSNMIAISSAFANSSSLKCDSETLHLERFTSFRILRELTLQLCPKGCLPQEWSIWCPAHLQPLVVTGTYLWRLWWEWQRRRRKVCPNPSPRPQLNGYPALPCPRAVSGSQCLRKGRWQNARPTSLRENIADVGCFLGKLVRLVKYIVQWNRKLIIAFPLLLLLIMQLLNY